MQYTTEFPAKVFYNNSSDLSVDFKILDLSRTKRRNTRATTSFGTGGSLAKESVLQPLYRSRIPLPEKKVTDLKALKPYVSEQADISIMVLLLSLDCVMKNICLTNVYTKIMISIF